jgi:hypothetical protein
MVEPAQSACCGHNCTACLSGSCCFPRGDETVLMPVPAAKPENYARNQAHPKQGPQKYEKRSKS